MKHKFINPLEKVGDEKANLAKLLEDSYAAHNLTKEELKQSQDKMSKQSMLCE